MRESRRGSMTRGISSFYQVVILHLTLCAWFKNCFKLKASNVYHTAWGRVKPKVKKIISQWIPTFLWIHPQQIHLWWLRIHPQNFNKVSRRAKISRNAPQESLNKCEWILTESEWVFLKPNSIDAVLMDLKSFNCLEWILSSLLVLSEFGWFWKCSNEFQQSF